MVRLKKSPAQAQTNVQTTDNIGHHFAANQSDEAGRQV